MQYGLLLTLVYLALATLPHINCVKIGRKQKGNSTIAREISAEKKLIRKLLSHYRRVGKAGRPVVNDSTAVPVRFGLGLIQMDLDERNKILTMSMWTKFHWRDQYLVWDPDEYGGVKQIRLESDQVWAPDVMLYNTYEHAAHWGGGRVATTTAKRHCHDLNLMQMKLPAQYKIFGLRAEPELMADVDNAMRDALAVVRYNGWVHWFPHSVFRSSCSVDVSNFPFDFQQCHMWFGSWTHYTRELNLTMAFPGGIDLSTFQSDHKESSSWDVLNVTAERNVMPNDKVPDNFVVLQFELNMRRKMVFSSYILTLPCVFLACLTLVVFWLPPERPDRTALAMSIFSSFMLLLLILVEAAPPTASSVPTLGIYYCFNMVIIMLSIFLSSLVVNITRGGTAVQKVPRWLSMLTISGLARILCLHGPMQRRKRGSKHRSNEEETIGIMRDGRDATMLDCMTELNGAVCRERSLAQQIEDCACNNLFLKSIERQVAEVRKSLQRIESRFEEKHYGERESIENIKEWKAVGLVLDRFFFVVYILLIVLSLIVLFPKPQ